MASLGPYCHDRGPIFPSTARASSFSKSFIIWHSVSDSKIHFWCNQSFLAFYLFSFSIFLASSGSFTVKNDNIHSFFFRCFGCKFLICRIHPKTKIIHGLDRFHGNGLYCKILTEKEPIRAQGFA